MLVDSTSPGRGENAGYYSAVCLEIEEVEWMETATPDLGRLPDAIEGEALYETSEQVVSATIFSI